MLEKGSERHDALVDPSNAGRRYVYAPGAPCVVLLHGLTATPNQYESLAPLLVARGRNVLVPRLPRHGYRDRMTTALVDLEVAELIASVKVALREAREVGSTVTVAGFSLGGTLAAYAAQREEIERAVCIAPFLGVRWLPNFVNRSLPWMLERAPNFFLWWNPIKRNGHGGRDGYARYPSAALREAYVLSHALFEDAASNAPRARSIAMITNPGELTCDSMLAVELARRWKRRGADVDTIELEPMGFAHDFMTPRRSPVPGQARAYARIVDAIIGP